MGPMGIKNKQEMRKRKRPEWNMYQGLDGFLENMKNDGPDIRRGKIDGCKMAFPVVLLSKVIRDLERSECVSACVDA